MNEFLATAPLWLPGVVAMMCLIVASAFFSGSETAIFYLSRDEIRALQVGKPRERMVAALLRDPERLLTAVLFWNLVINLTTFAVSVATARRLVNSGQPAAAGIFAVCGLIGVILFGEVLPKSAAVMFRRSIATLVSWPLALAVRSIAPIAPLLSGTARGLRRAFWPHLKREPYLEAGDLDRAVETSELDAELIRQEQQVLHNIIDLSEITVEEVMRPRGTYLVWKPPVHLVHLHGKLPDADYLLIQDQGGDDIIAAVPLNALSSIPERHLESVAEDVVHVPWCATLADTLHLLRERLHGLATVVNEYGETIGIVTYEDIMDSIIAPLPSRGRRVLRREPVLQVAADRYHVDGITTLRHLAQRLDMKYEPTAEGLVTVAGMLHEQLERMPQVDDEATWCGCRIKVIDVGPRGHLRVMVTPPQAGEVGDTQAPGAPA